MPRTYTISYSLAPCQSLTICKKTQSRGERETQKQFLHIREEKDKSEFLCLVSRGEREISNLLAQFREEKEKPEFLSPVSRGEREILNSFAQFREEKEKLENILNF